MKNWSEDEMNRKGNLKTKLAAVFSAGVLAVTGTAAAVSGMTLRASAADLQLDNYAKLLQYSLYFYDANMCGSKAGESAFSWRDACHANDVVDGGFHDAGDNVKFEQTMGFTSSTMGWMYYEYKDQFEKTGVAQHYQVLMDYFCDYYKGCTTLSGDEVTSFVYQIDDNSDHSTWCPPEGMNSRGSDKTYTTSNSASDIAAEFAATLAQNYMFTGDEEDLKYATALYNFADKYRKVETNQNNYAYDGVQDDISWAAGWMYLATKEQKYLDESNKYNNYSNGWTKDYCWADSWLGAAILNAEITGNWTNATSYIDGVVNSNQNQFYVMNSWGSARHNTLMQTCALVVSHHKDESGKDYSEWAKKQMNYILGDNNANVCLVVGYNDVSATSPHHRAASNLTISPDWHEFNNWDGKYSSTNGHTLYGALCGGPTSSDFKTYNDTAKDATSNEVALDYQIGLVGAAAGLYAAYGTGSVVAEIAPEVTVYSAEVAAANGETPQPGTTETTEQTTTTTEETTTTAETTTTEDTTETPDPMAAWEKVPDSMIVGETAEASVTYSIISNDFQWASSDPDILSVEGNGNKATLTAKQPGVIALTASNGFETLLKEITVYPAETTATTVETTTETTETTTVSNETETTVSESDTTATSSETTTETTNTTATGAPAGTLYGDINLDGRVDITDAVLLNKVAAGAVTLDTPEKQANADCDANGEVDGKDAVVLLKFLVSLIKTLPSAE
ncbi:glycoside hydrolase family 9 protein [uncultured Ruminococcus sp.]|uniref:glycoside hydrolase family 9 protein n=1 Tax=uncultured Ruminococcus sp. TaxID=165186 RepID=UPI0025FDC0D3|nr:glycoside hydrolase family 9 protein [uncultured Ruminococcus sp.]